MRGGRLIAFAVITTSLDSACTSPRTNMHAKPPMVDAMGNGNQKLKVVPVRVDASSDKKEERPNYGPKPWKIGDVVIQPASQGKGADYLLEPKPLNELRLKAKPRL